jgi:hypothetical protein
MMIRISWAGSPESCSSAVCSTPKRIGPTTIDLAIEVAPKETDRGRFQQQNHARAKLLAKMGHSFSARSGAVLSQQGSNLVG